MRGIIEINLKILENNLKYFKSRAGGEVKIACVVKANAYGHGLREVVKATENLADYYVVATVEEGLEVRGVTATPTLLLCPLSIEETAVCIENKLEMSIGSIDDAERIISVSENMRTGAYVHFCVDTGMNRMGFKDEKSLYKSINMVKNCRTVTIKGIYSHFFDGKNEAITIGQFNTFRRFTRGFNKTVIRHISATDGFSYEKYRLDMCRIGIGLYGYELGEVEPCLAVRSYVARVAEVKKGETVGYGGRFKAEKDEIIATISMGYGDGLPRSFTGGFILIGGKKRKVIGNICMDYCFAIVDRSVKAGDEAVLIGKQGAEVQTAEEIAEKCGTISYEILTGLKRFKRIYKM